MEVIHAYVLPRPGIDDAMLALAHACGPTLADFPIAPAVPSHAGEPGTLHLTIEMVADAPPAAIVTSERQVLADALRKQLADVEPFDTEVGPPIGNRAGAVLDVWPEADVVAVQERVRAAIRTTRGAAALQHNGGRPHIQLGYNYDMGDSDSLNSRLRAITPRRVPLHIDTVHLLSVRFAVAPDTGVWRMSWAPIVALPLGSRR